MCELCIQHGEGKKWYEVMRHYSAELLAEQGRLDYMRRFIPQVRRNADANIRRLTLVKEKLPFAYGFVRRLGDLRMKRLHYGQVVPLEDAEMIVDLVQSVTRIACVCRSVTTGDTRARYCLLLGIDPAGIIDDWVDLSTTLETLQPPEAKKLLREFDQQGLVHSIWTFKTPFIGAICNCDQDCLAYRVQITNDLLNLLSKGEYLAEVNMSSCAGCRACEKLCPFDAIEFSATSRKCQVNAAKCYGCGVCRAGCPMGALELEAKQNG